MDILSRISREIVFDRVRVWEQADGGRQLLSTVPFAEWENPYFPAATSGRIAAQYNEPGQADVPRQKPQRKKAQER